MNRYILSIALIFFASIRIVQAQQPSSVRGCVQDDECFTFRFVGAEAAGNNITLTFSITTHCEHALSYAAFELPKGAKVIDPKSSYRSTNRYIVEQTNNPFLSIKFEAKNAEEYKNGASDTFSFTIPASDYENLTTMQVQAKAGKTVGNVTFNPRDCGAEPEACLIEGSGANFAFTGATDNGNGTTTVRLKIINKVAADVNTVTIATAATNEVIGVAGVGSGNIYRTEGFEYAVAIDQEANLITFEARNTDGYASGASDVFSIIVPSDLYESEPYFQLSMAAGDTFENAGLNTISCEDEPINPLPVELLSFEGKATHSGIALEWTTASEDNNEKFEVQRSQNGKSFEKIAEVAGAGNSATLLRYSYTDRAAAPGINYYRLRQVDFDGQYEYSKVVAVNSSATSANASLQVYPNPATNNYVHVTLSPSSSAQLQIMDRNGRMVYTQEVTPGSQEVQLSTADLNMPNGLYYIHVFDGTERQVQKLIVQ